VPERDSVGGSAVALSVIVMDGVLVCVCERLTDCVEDEESLKLPDRDAETSSEKVGDAERVTSEDSDTEGLADGMLESVCDGLVETDLDASLDIDAVSENEGDAEGEAVNSSDGVDDTVRDKLCSDDAVDDFDADDSSVLEDERD
jgi:hypothetical protein